MSKPINPVVIDAEIMGRCPQCRGDFKGFMDMTLMKQNATIPVHLKCFQCGHLGNYFVNWPDELPKVQLRHKRNRQLVSSGVVRKRRRRKENKNPDQVLKGQLAFDIPNAAHMRAGIIT